MKLCWDNIETIRLTKKGNFYDVVKKKTYYYNGSCLGCGEPFFSNKGARFCSKHCSNKINGFDKKHSDKTKRKSSIKS